MIDWLVEWLIDWLIDWLIGWLIDWLIGWLNDWLIEWSASGRTGWMIEWLIGWMIDWVSGWVGEWMTLLASSLTDWRWQSGWVIDWLSNWLIDWLTRQWPVYRQPACGRQGRAGRLNDWSAKGRIGWPDSWLKARIAGGTVVSCGLRVGRWLSEWLNDWMIDLTKAEKLVEGKDCGWNGGELRVRGWTVVVKIIEPCIECKARLGIKTR